jgi:CBS domain-containing protein
VTSSGSTIAERARFADGLAHREKFSVSHAGRGARRAQVTGMTAAHGVTRRCGYREKGDVMRCADVMTMGLRVLPDSATVQQAAAVMRANSLGFLPVCDPEGRLVGVITDRDIAVRVAPYDQVPSSVQVIDVMTPRPLVCGPREPVEAAEHRMIRGGIARMMVVDEGNFPLGIISLTDLLLKDRSGRALETARQVLSREASGPHSPINDIQLTPAAPPGVGSMADLGSDYQGTNRWDSVLFGGSETRGMKEFPR